MYLFTLPVFNIASTAGTNLPVRDIFIVDCASNAALQRAAGFTPAVRAYGGGEPRRSLNELTANPHPVESPPHLSPKLFGVRDSAIFDCDIDLLE
jgi:hypothetical protein